MRFTNMNETDINTLELEAIFRPYRKFFPKKSVEIYEETRFFHDFNVVSCNIRQKRKHEGRFGSVMNIELLLKLYDEEIRVMFFCVSKANMNILMLDPENPQFSEGMDMIYCSMLERENGKNSFECLFSSDSHFYIEFEKIKISWLKKPSE